MKKTILISLAAVIMLAGAAGAQTGSGSSSVFIPGKSFEKPTGFLNSLLDPSRFSMTHSYSLSFGRIGNYSMNTGLYMNTMTYKIAESLTSQVRIGFMHQPFGGDNNLYRTGSKVFVQRAMMQYKPSDKFSVTVDYQAFPVPMMNPYGYGYTRHGYTNW